eukprot:jgi/Mesen1/4796/ME000243S03975
MARLIIFFMLCSAFVSAFGETEAVSERHVHVDAYFRPPQKFTERPTIGMLTLPVTEPKQRTYGPSSFATSYVRWIEAGGARVVPIFYDSSAEELDFILQRVNAIVWTGGLVDFNPTLSDPEGAKYLKTTSKILSYVIAENAKGKYYPLWGTCLGFERMTQLLAEDPNGDKIIQKVDAENYDINLGFTSAGWLSRVFGGMTYELFKEVASPIGHLAFNNHGLGVHPVALSSSPASKYLKVLSIDEDRNGLPFISTVEGISIPLYGTQWHPEKAPWEWTPKYNIAHSETALTFSSYLGRFLVEEAKYNSNSFENETLLSQYLVANWPSRPTGAAHGIISAYSEIIFFDTHNPSTRKRARVASSSGAGISSA